MTKLDMTLKRATMTEEPMTTTESLEDIQKRIDALGIKDVKILFSPEAYTKPVEQVKEQVAELLRAYLAGNYKKIEWLDGEPVEFDHIPDFADKRTLKEFFNAMNWGFLIPDDGDGYYTKDDMESNVSVWNGLKVPTWATGVAWYNR